MDGMEKTSSLWEVRDSLLHNLVGQNVIVALWLVKDI